jgi:hypothetical protein
MNLLEQLNGPSPKILLQRFLENDGYLRGTFNCLRLYDAYPDLHHLINFRANYKWDEVLNRGTYEIELKAGASALSLIRQKYS